VPPGQTVNAKRQEEKPARGGKQWQVVARAGKWWQAAASGGKWRQVVASGGKAAQQRMRRIARPPRSSGQARGGRWFLPLWFAHKVLY